jgi:hypothetical protein
MNNSLKEDLSKGRDNFQEYLDARLDLLRLNMAHNFSKVLSGFIIKAVVMFVLSFALLFISFGIADWLNTQIDYPGTGYIVVAVFYIIIMIIFWFLRRRLVEGPVIQAMIEIFFPADENFEQNNNE